MYILFDFICLCCELIFAKYNILGHTVSLNVITLFCVYLRIGFSSSVTVITMIKGENVIYYFYESGIKDMVSLY